jgi:3-oxoacyl-[acyl-carrier-protein] synthase II
VLPTKQRVYVTGLGVVSTVGCDAKQFWQRLQTGSAHVEATPGHWRNFYSASSQIWSPLPDPQFADYGLSRTDRLLLSKAAQIGLVAATQAAASAKWEPSAVGASQGVGSPQVSGKKRAGVFVGTGLGGAPAPFDNYGAHLLGGFRQQLQARVEADPEDATAAALLSGLEGHPRVNPMVICQTMPNALAAQIAIRFGVQEHVETTCAACASGTIAIGKAFRAIQRGELDVALAGGIEHLGDRAGGVFMGFDRLNTLAKPFREMGSENRPFDAERRGFLFSEGGAGIAFLESEASLHTRGGEPLAEVLGFAETNDAYSIAAISDEQNAIEPMFRQVLLDAGLKAGDIDYINAHGTGTQINDRVEGRILERMFGRRPWVNSTKSILGHTIGASGALEFVVAVLSLQHQAVHPCLNLEDPIVDLNFTLQGGAAPIQTVLTHSFGFGGHNAALVLARVEPV